MNQQPTTLRATKRRQTHELIANAAALLFATNGFEAVTIDDVARAAGVGRQTVFNHFATKEDLVFDEADERRASLLEAVTGRQPNTTPLSAVRDWTIAQWQPVRTTEVDGRPDSGIFTLVGGSAALQARGRELTAMNAAALADVLDINSPTTAHVLATALVAVDQSMFTAMTRHVMQGRRAQDVLPDLLKDALWSFQALERGLATWPS